jgi:hypothetical protein
MPIEGSNPYRDFSDDALIGRMNDQGAGPNAILGEVTRRLKDSVVEQNHASTALAERITRLNVWLLVATLAILALTGVLVWSALRDMLR